MRPPDCCPVDARSGRARTSPTSGARRASSRSRRGAAPSRGETPQGLRRPWPALALTATRGPAAASGSLGAASRSRPGPRTMRTRSRNDPRGRARRRVGSLRCCGIGVFRGQHHALAVALHELAEERFARPVGVEIGGLNEIAPGLAEGVVHLSRFVLGRTPTPLLAEGHRAERGLRNSKPAVTQ